MPQRDQTSSNRPNGDTRRRPLWRRCARRVLIGKTADKPVTRERVLRRAVRLGSIVVLVLVVLVVLPTRTPLAKALVLPRLERALGAEIDAGSLFIASDLSVIVTDASVRTRAVSGPGGELLRFDRLEARANWLRLLSGARDGIVRRVVLDAPELVLSQDVDTGVLNAATLALTGGGSSSVSIGELPAVTVRDGRLVLGEHSGGSMEVLHAFPFEGELTPVRQTDGGADVFVVRVDPRAMVGGGAGTGVGRIGADAELRGRISPDGVAIAIRGVSVEDWPASRVPTRLRPVYERLGLRGRLEPKRVRVDRAGAVEIDVALDSVALDLPFNAQRPGTEGAFAPDDRPLRMERVDGELTAGTTGLRAKLAGTLDGVPYRVAFDYWGLGAESPFLARLLAGPVRVERGDNVFRFTPEVVIEKLDLFLDPVVEMTSTVWLRRGVTPSGASRVFTADLALPDTLTTPTGTADSRILVAGEIELTDGSARFKNFPYPFAGINGVFAFNEERLEIRDVRAASDSGAQLTVDGWVAPLSDSAQVQLSIGVADLPINGQLVDILGPKRQEALNALFSVTQIERLYEDGLLTRPGEEHTPGVPEFALGGTADVLVNVERLFGIESIWKQRIEIGLNDARMLSEQFPLPLLGDGVSIVVQDDIAQIDGGTYTTLRGGDVTLWARADVSRNDDKPPPSVRITAADVPIDDLLIYAIPGPGALADEDGPANLSSLLDRLRLRGTLDCVADVGPHPEYGFGWDIVVNIDNVNASPDPRGAVATRDAEDDAPERELLLDGLTGIIHAQRDLIEFELAATARRGGFEPLDPMTLLNRPASVRMNASVDLPVRSPEDPTVFTEASVEGLDLDLPIERLLSLFAPEFAGRIIELRDEFTPAGRMDMTTTLTARLGADLAGSARIELTADNIESFSADAFGGRADLTGVTGRAVLDTGAAAIVSFDELDADLTFDGDAAGRITLTGLLPLGVPADWPIIGTPDFAQLELLVDGGRFDSTLTETIVTERLGEGLAELYRQTEPAGDYDLALYFTPLPPEDAVTIPDGDADDPTPANNGPQGGALLRADIAGTLRPASIALSTAGGRMDARSTSGSVSFTGRGGSFDELRGFGDGWSFTTSGDWRAPEQGVFRLIADIEADVDARAEGLPPALLGAFPTTWTDLIDTLKLDATGGIELRRARVTLERDGLGLGDAAGPPLASPVVSAGSDPSVDPGINVLFRGDARFAGASLELGLPVSYADGDARFEFWSRPGPDPDALPTADERGWSIAVSGERAFVSGMEITGVQARVLGEGPGVVLVPEVSGNVHGGRVSGSARLDPQPGFDLSTPELNAAKAAPMYTGEARFADVRLAPLLADLSLGARPDPEALASSIAADRTGPASREPDGSRGVLDADLTVTGIVGDPRGIRGRGRVRASGGPVLALPVLTPLIEFSNLQLPIGENLDLAESSFFIRDERMIFESISVLSESIEILGFGSMHWPTADVDLRFRSEAVRRIPLVSSLIEAVRDELITTRLTGPVGELSVSADALLATRRALGSVLGFDESPEAARLRRIEREARRERERALRVLRRTEAPAATSESGEERGPPSDGTGRPETGEGV
ncbi:MAG: hypothetical protein AAF297_07515 [Planctomycetota bacterium]